MISNEEQNRRDHEAMVAQRVETARQLQEGADLKIAQLRNVLGGGQQSSATRTPPRSNGQPYFQPGGVGEARDGLLAAIFAPVMYACYMAAARELSKSEAYPMPKAFGHAMSVVWQWKAWSFTLFYWVISGACIWFWRGAEALQGDPATGYTTGRDVSFQTKLLVLHALLLLPAILLPYCQAVDASFFKRRTLYTILRPIHAVTSWVPWFVWQSTVLLPLLFIIQYRW